MLTTGANPQSLLAADLDGDGWLDLVSADGGSNRLSIFFQTAPGVFPPTASAALLTGFFPEFVVAADFDGDGLLDLVSADGLSNRLSIFLQTSPGVFPPTASAALTTGFSPRSVVAADLDGDGLPDLVSADGNDNRLSVFFNY